MSVSHSVYAAYGVVIAPPRDWGGLDVLLEAQTPHADGGEPAVVRIHLFTVGDSEHVILATGSAELEPNTYRAVPSLAISAQWDDALREHVKNLGLTVRSGPCWHLVHDPTLRRTACLVGAPEDCRQPSNQGDIFAVQRVSSPHRKRH